MKKPLWPGWMAEATLAEMDAEDAAQREREVIDWVADLSATWERDDFAEWFPGSLKHVDAHIAPEQDWP